MGHDAGDAMPRVAVVGGGLAGLLLARRLQHAGIAVTVFEGDEGPDARSQGGSLDLHAASGQRALKSAKLFDQFTAHVQPGADAMCLMDSQMNILYSDDGDGSRPEIERSDLRKILLDGVNKEAVLWGCKLQSIEAPVHTNDPLKLVFTNGSAKAADVIIGADGAWSTVRAVLTDVRPQYSGVSFVDTVLSSVNTQVSSFPRGTLMALGPDQCMVLGHLTAQTHLYFGKACPEGSLTDSSAADIVKGWATPFGALATAKGQAVARKIEVLPPGTRWTRDATWKGRVTLIGDAAHLMSPFAGEGANLALADAADLADLLTPALTSKDWRAAVPSAISRFETRCMWIRAERAAKESANNLEIFKQGPDAVATWFAEMMGWRGMLAMGWQWLCDSFWSLFGYRNHL